MVSGDAGLLLSLRLLVSFCIKLSLICAEVPSSLQQLAPPATVKDYCAQLAVVRMLQCYGQLLAYPMTNRNIPDKVALIVLLDAGSSTENDQVSYISGLLLGDMRSGSRFHVL